MELEDAVVLVTGANRGLGLAFAREALARGARKVYAASRDPTRVILPGVSAVQLDVTRADEVAAAAQECSDVTLLINNAGIATKGGFLARESEGEIRAMFETNFYGPLRVSRAFASVLAANGGGAILNVLSVASWINSSPMLGGYGASKSAAWAMTNGLRQELASQQTQVLGLHVGFIDTDMTHDFDFPKSRPEAVVREAFDGLSAGASEVLADDVSRRVHQGLTNDPPVYLQPWPHH